MFFFSIILKESFTAKLNREEKDLSKEKEIAELASMMDALLTDGDETPLQRQSFSKCKVKEAEEKFYDM